jgi:hypothetical protein
MIVLDVEIKKAILGRGEAAIEGIDYCNGWRDFPNMGISCVCTYDMGTHLSRVFLEEDFQALTLYLDGKRTAGFNTRRFDNPLLAAHGIEIDEARHYDMLEQIWVVQGFDPDKFYYKTHGGWGLDAVCDATLGIRKTGHGALAPVWWQQGRRGKVIDYCLNDVWMEATLLAWIIQHGWVIATDKPRIRLPHPDTVLEDALRGRGVSDDRSITNAFLEVPHAQVPGAAQPHMGIDPATDPPTTVVMGACNQHPQGCPPGAHSGLGIIR